MVLGEQDEAASRRHACKREVKEACRMGKVGGAITCMHIHV